MRQVPTTEVKSRFAEFLREIEQGERLAISRHGKVIAYLVPAEDAQRAACRDGVDRFLAAARRWRSAGFTREEALAARHEGHRF